VKKSREMHDLGLISLMIAGLVLTAGCHRGAGIQQAATDPMADKKAAADSIPEADKNYAQRADLAKVRTAVALLRQARTMDYGNFEVAWKLARADYYLGTHTTDQEADNAFREGIEAGKFAVQLQGGRPEGHFWLGANYGGSAQISTLAGLSSVEDIRHEMEEVLKIDHTFQGGSAYLALGQLYLEAPKVLGGDSAKAIDLLTQGVKVAPDNALLKVYLAEAYHTAGRDAEARKQVDDLMAMTPSQDYLPEYKEAVEKSKKLLEKMR